MNKFFKAISVTLSVAVLMIAISIPTTILATATTTPAATIGDTYNYFTDKYPSLAGKGDLFQTAALYEFSNFLLGNADMAAMYKGLTPERTNQPTNQKIVFLLGGAYDPAMQNGISAVYDWAKTYGIPTIFNFDPHLDGQASSVADITAATPFNDYYKLILLKLGLTAAQVKFPSVIVYQKDSQFGGHVISSYTWTATSSATDMAQGLSVAFNAAAVNGKISNVFNMTASDYYKNVIDARYFNSYGSTVINSVTVLSDAYKSGIRPLDMSKDCVFEVVTLDQVKGLLASQGNYAVMLGGLWCHNTWAMSHVIQQQAEKFGIKKVYVYDTILDSNSGQSYNGVSCPSLQTRQSADASQPVTNIASLYTSLINTYLGNIYTLNQGEYDQAVNSYTVGKLPISRFSSATYKSPISSKMIQAFTDSTSTADTSYSRRAQLPNFFVYNKASKVVSQVEMMTEQWFVNDGSGSLWFNKDTVNQNGSYPFYSATLNNPTPEYDFMVNGYTRALPAYTVPLKATDPSITSADAIPVTYTFASPFTVPAYSYWSPGMTQTMGALGSLALNSLISKAIALNTTNAGVVSALATANAVKTATDALVAQQNPLHVPDGAAIASASAGLQAAMANMNAPATTVSTAASSSKSSPNTGDNTNMIILVSIFAMAILGFGLSKMLKKAN